MGLKKRSRQAGVTGLGPCVGAQAASARRSQLCASRGPTTKPLGPPAPRPHRLQSAACRSRVAADCPRLGHHHGHGNTRCSAKAQTTAPFPQAACWQRALPLRRSACLTQTPNRYQIDSCLCLVYKHERPIRPISHPNKTPPIHPPPRGAKTRVGLGPMGHDRLLGACRRAQRDRCRHDGRARRAQTPYCRGATARCAAGTAAS